MYDALGRRTSATDGASSYDYLIAPAAQRLGAGVLDVEVQHLATNGAGGLLQGWVYAGENPILRYDNAGNVEYYLESANDSIAAIIDNGVNPTVVAEYEFDGFGNVLNGVDPTSNAGGDFGFHAAWRETETGLYHMRARTYDPETGRFTSPDPADPNPQAPETYEPYSFANNNPHLFSDPTGLFSITEINVGGAIQNSMRGLRHAAIHEVKQRIKEEVQAAATELLFDSLKHLLPIPQAILESGLKARAAIAGGSFEGILVNSICGFFGQGLPENILNKFSFGPRIGVDGHPQSNGISCQPRPNVTNIPSGGQIAANFDGTPFANPDFVLKDTVPLDTSNRAWTVGDIKLTVNNLYKSYVEPGDQVNQWNAMANYARRHGYRIVTFIAFKKLNERGSELFEEILLKEGAGKGVIVLLASFDF